MDSMKKKGKGFKTAATNVNKLIRQKTGNFLQKYLCKIKTNWEAQHVNKSPGWCICTKTCVTESIIDGFTAGAWFKGSSLPLLGPNKVLLESRVSDASLLLLMQDY